MAEWPKSRQLAALYQSPGTTGIGFARYASSGFVSPELWENIRTTESLAESNKGKPAVEHWAEEMAELRQALTEEGVRERKLEVTETGPDQITVQFDGLEIQLWRSSLESDKGQPVVQIDGAGMVRVNVNDYPIWNADPDDHEHHECQCVIDFEMKEEA